MEVSDGLVKTSDLVDIQTKRCQNNCQKENIMKDNLNLQELDFTHNLNSDYYEDGEAAMSNAFDTSLDSNLTSITNNKLGHSNRLLGSMEEDIERLMSTLSEVTKEKDNLMNECGKYQMLETKTKEMLHMSLIETIETYYETSSMLKLEKEFNNKMIGEINILQHQLECEVNTRHSSNKDDRDKDRGHTMNVESFIAKVKFIQENRTKYSANNPNIFKTMKPLYNVVNEMNSIDTTLECSTRVKSDYKITADNCHKVEAVEEDDYEMSIIEGKNKQLNQEYDPNTQELIKQQKFAINRLHEKTLQAKNLNEILITERGILERKLSDLKRVYDDHLKHFEEQISIGRGIAKHLTEENFRLNRQLQAMK